MLEVRSRTLFISSSSPSLPANLISHNQIPATSAAGAAARPVLVNNNMSCGAHRTDCFQRLRSVRTAVHLVQMFPATERRWRVTCEAGKATASQRADTLDSSAGARPRRPTPDAGRRLRRPPDDTSRTAAGRRRAPRRTAGREPDAPGRRPPDGARRRPDRVKTGPGKTARAPDRTSARGPFCFMRNNTISTHSRDVVLSREAKI